jgi:tRNA(Ile)-lysidine synthase
MPKIREEWRNVDDNIVAFGKIVKTDNEYIETQCDMNGIIKDGNCCRIPLNRFVFPAPIISRLLFKCMDMLGIKSNIETKHIDAILNLSVDGLNGEKTDLPNHSYAVREYEYITIVKKERKTEDKSYPFKIGKTVIEGFGTILITKTISHKLAVGRGLLTVDADKLPKKARWRFRTDGDMFTKFGGGTKKLSAYMSDKKIPARLRGTIPVLADGRDILVVGGVEISEKVKTTRDTLDAFVLEFTRE